MMKNKFDIEAEIEYTKLKISDESEWKQYWIERLKLLQNILRYGRNENE